MTQAQASTEALKRWGERGRAIVRRYPFSLWDEKRGVAVQFVRMTYQVGRLVRRGARMSTLGSGDSWEEAFADADLRRKRDLSEIAALDEERSGREE